MTGLLYLVGFVLGFGLMFWLIMPFVWHLFGDVPKWYELWPASVIAGLSTGGFLTYEVQKNAGRRYDTTG